MLVQVLETGENLSCDAFHDTRSNTLSAVLLDKREKVLAERLERHTDVGTGGGRVGERVKEGYDMGSAGVSGSGVLYLLEQLDFVASGLSVSSGRLDNFEGRVSVLSAKSDSGVNKCVTEGGRKLRTVRP